MITHKDLVAFLRAGYSRGGATQMTSEALQCAILEQAAVGLYIMLVGNRLFIKLFTRFSPPESVYNLG